MFWWLLWLYLALHFFGMCNKNIIIDNVSNLLWYDHIHNFLLQQNSLYKGHKKHHLRYWTGVWSVVHVELVWNAIHILSCVLPPFLYNVKSSYIGYWKIYVKMYLRSKQIIQSVVFKTILSRNIFHCMKLFLDWVPFQIVIVYLYIWTPACPLYYYWEPPINYEHASFLIMP